MDEDGIELRLAQRGNHVRWTRVGVVISLLIAVGFSLTGLMSNPKVVKLRLPSPRLAQQRLQAASAEVSRAWHPDDRARALQRLRNAEGQDELRKALSTALRDPGSKMQKKALIECAGALNATEVRNEIAAIAMHGAGPAQIAAIDVAHRLRAWRADEVAELLQSRDRAVRLGLLGTVASHGGELPEEALLECLTSDDAEERALALRACPSKPSAALIDELRRVIVHGSPVAAAQALRALARDQAASNHAEVVFAALHGRATEVRHAALEFLLAVDDLPRRPELVWTVVVDTSAEEKLRLFALHCLERVGGADPEALGARAVLMTSAERLLAARCLLRQGNPDCLEMLLGLLGRDDDETAVESARRLLAWMTGASMDSSPEQFRVAFERIGRRIRTRYLPDHGLNLD